MDDDPVIDHRDKMARTGGNVNQIAEVEVCHNDEADVFNVEWEDSLQFPDSEDEYIAGHGEGEGPPDVSTEKLKELDACAAIEEIEKLNNMQVIQPVVLTSIEEIGGSSLCRDPAMGTRIDWKGCQHFGQICEGQWKEEERSSCWKKEQAATFRSGLGLALYMAMDRPDIQLAAKTLSSYMSRPTIKSLAALKHLASYLDGTPDDGILLPMTEEGKTLSDIWKEDELISDEAMVPDWTGSGRFILEAYSDSSWADCKTTRKSTSSGLIFLNGALVMSVCRTQASVALSSCEAELYAANGFMVESIYLFRLCKFLWGNESEVGSEMVQQSLFTDSSSALALVRGIKAEECDVQLVWWSVAEWTSSTIWSIAALLFKMILWILFCMVQIAGVSAILVALMYLCGGLLIWQHSWFLPRFAIRNASWMIGFRWTWLIKPVVWSAWWLLGREIMYLHARYQEFGQSGDIMVDIEALYAGIDEYLTGGAYDVGAAALLESPPMVEAEPEADAEPVVEPEPFERQDIANVALQHVRLTGQHVDRTIGETENDEMNDRVHGNPVEMEVDEAASQRERRYRDSSQEEVSDPDEWAERHYGELEWDNHQRMVAFSHANQLRLRRAMESLEQKREAGHEQGN
eukprot:s730_g8.t1